jgi:O-antigen/teichoic acid export membrane protein
VVQHGGGALAQALSAVVGWGGAVGLVAGALLATAGAWLVAGLGSVAVANRPRAAAIDPTQGPPGPVPPAANPPNGPRLPWRPWPEGRLLARRYRDFPLLNTPHAFLGALQDTAAVALIAATAGPAAAGVWVLALRYLKAPATLVGGAVSQMLYPALAQRGEVEGQALLRRVVLALLVAAVALALGIWAFADPALGWLLGGGWAPAGPLAQALAVYIAAHFVASPLGVVTLAWRAQAWALKMAVAGQIVFLGALWLGLSGAFGPGGLPGAARAVSVAMLVFYGVYAAWLTLAPPRDNAGS